MKDLPYTKKYRLADVLALIQVLAMYEYAHRTQDGIQKEFQGNPRSAKSWIDVAKEHPEFFRVREGKGIEISLIARHAKEGYPELSTEYTAKLMETAIKIHDSQLVSSRWWTFWMPVIGVVIGAFMGALLTKLFTK